MVEALRVPTPKRRQVELGNAGRSRAPRLVVPREFPTTSERFGIMNIAGSLT